MASSPRLFIAVWLSLLGSFLLVAAVAGKNALKLDTIDGNEFGWSNLYEYIQKSKPVKLSKAYTEAPAVGKWSSEYMFGNPGSALTYRNLTKQSTVSLRTIVGQREYFMQMHFRTPKFLRADLILPRCLDCDQLVQRMNTPAWLWHFQKTQIKLHSEKPHELWCTIRGSFRLTLLPEWSDGMIDHWVTKKVLDEAPTYKETKYYRVDMDAGDCLLIPAEILRQWEPTEDAMAIIFQIENSATKLERCQSIGGAGGMRLDRIRFADDGKREEGFIDGTEVVEKLISYLDTDTCLDRSEFREAVSADSDLITIDNDRTDQAANEIFAALDRDEDGEFCWPDVDSLSLTEATELTKLVNTKLAMRREENRGGRKIDEL